MNRDEITKGMGWPALANHIPDAADDLICRIESLVRSAAAAEREACAKVCDDIGGADAWDCAAAIRARGEK